MISGGVARRGPWTSTGGGTGGGGTTRLWMSQGSGGTIIQPPSLAHACNERGCGKDGIADIDRRRRRRRRDNPIVDITGERRRDNLTVDVAGERQRNNLTAVVGPLSVAGRTALPLPPAGSSGAFFAVPPAATILQANTAEDNKDDCACVEDARDKWGRGEEARRDRRRQQEEAPVEEGQPNCGRCGGAAAR